MKHACLTVETHRGTILLRSAGRGHATTCNLTPSYSCKQAMILNRFAAAGFAENNLPLAHNGR